MWAASKRATRQDSSWEPGGSAARADPIARCGSGDFLECDKRREAIRCWQRPASQRSAWWRSILMARVPWTKLQDFYLRLGFLKVLVAALSSERRSVTNQAIISQVEKPLFD